MMPPCPECDKISEVHDRSQLIGEFLVWLNTEKHLSICKLTEPETSTWRPVAGLFDGHEALIAQFFCIDLAKAERERRALLDAIRVTA